MVCPIWLHSLTWRVFVHPILSNQFYPPPTFLQSRRNSSCNSSFTALPDRKSVVFPRAFVLTAMKLWSCRWPLASLSNMGQQDVMDSCQWIFESCRSIMSIWSAGTILGLKWMVQGWDICSPNCAWWAHLITNWSEYASQQNTTKHTVLVLALYIQWGGYLLLDHATI